MPFVTLECPQVDVVFKNPAKSVQMRAMEICAMLSSLAVSTNYEAGQVSAMAPTPPRPHPAVHRQEMVAENSFGESERYFQAVFEVGRRYKVPP